MALWVRIPYLDQTLTFLGSALKSRSDQLVNSECNLQKNPFTTDSWSSSVSGFFPFRLYFLFRFKSSFSCLASLGEFPSFCQSHFKRRPKSVLWCDWENNPSSWAGPLPSLEMFFVSPDMLRFRDPDSFVAESFLTICLGEWDQTSLTGF